MIFSYYSTADKSESNTSSLFDKLQPENAVKSIIFMWSTQLSQMNLNFHICSLAVQRMETHRYTDCKENKSIN